MSFVSPGHHPLYRHLWAELNGRRGVRPPRRSRRRLEHALVARVNDPALFRRLDRIRAALSGLGFARTVPDHALHLPILNLNRIPASRLAAVVERLQASLHGRAPFAVSVAHLNYANGGVFAEIDRVDEIAALSGSLREQLGLPADAAPGVPGFPLARITAPAAARPLVQALEWFRERPIGEVPVHALQIVTLDNREPDDGFRRVAVLPLGG